MKALTMESMRIYKILISFYVIADGNCRELRFLVMLPKTGIGWIGGAACQVAVDMALEDISSNGNILKDYNLTYNWFDSKITCSTVVCSKHICKDDYSSTTPVRKKTKTESCAFQIYLDRRALKQKILSPVKKTHDESDTQPDFREISTDIASTSDLEDTRDQEIKTMITLVTGRKISKLWKFGETIKNGEIWNKSIQNRIKI